MDFVGFKLGTLRTMFARSLFKKPSLWAAVVFCVLVVFIMTIYGFLAVNRPVGEGVLVVEAWIPSTALADAIPVFKAGHYQYLLVVGGPLPGIASATNYPATYADRAASTLQRYGFSSDNLIKIYVPPVSFNRTLTGAEEVKHWLEHSTTGICCVEVFTVGVHARKSWLLSEYVLGHNYRVGIIAAPEPSFNAQYWFFSPRGVWIVARNTAGYLYFKFWILFHSVKFSRQALSNLDLSIHRSSGHELILQATETIV